MDLSTDVRTPQGDVSSLSGGDEECPLKAARRVVHSQSTSMDMGGRGFDPAVRGSQIQSLSPSHMGGGGFDSALSEIEVQSLSPSEERLREAALGSSSQAPSRDRSRGAAFRSSLEGPSQDKLRGSASGSLLESPFEDRSRGAAPESSLEAPSEGAHGTQEEEAHRKHKSAHGGTTFRGGNLLEASRSMSHFPSLSRLRLSSRDPEAASPIVPCTKRAHSSGATPLPSRLQPGMVHSSGAGVAHSSGAGVAHSSGSGVAHSSAATPLPSWLQSGVAAAPPSSCSPRMERCHSWRGGSVLGSGSGSVSVSGPRPESGSRPRSRAGAGTGSGSGSGSGPGSGLLSLKRKRPPMLEIPLKDSFTASPQGTPSPLRDACGVPGWKENLDSVEVVKECGEEGRGYAVLCKRGRRREVMEDRFRAVTDLGGDTQLAFFGVYDGHGGTAAAHFVSKQLHLSLVESLKKRTAENAEAAVVDAYVDTDRLFLEHGSASGACCVTCLALPNELIVAHVGDCRAVMCCNGRALALTQDHKASREDERERIEALGGLVDDFTGTWRVQGVIAVTRGIGDLNLKEYISAVPETCTAVARTTEDFLILASDGLWDVVSNEEAVSIARSTLFPDHITANSMDNDTSTMHREPTENLIQSSDTLATQVKPRLNPPSQTQSICCSTLRGDSSLGVPHVDRSVGGESHKVALLSPSVSQRGGLSDAPCSLFSTSSGKICPGKICAGKICSGKISPGRRVEARWLKCHVNVKADLFDGSDRCGRVSQANGLLSSASKKLTDLAVKRGSCDDITVMVIVPALLKQ